MIGKLATNEDHKPARLDATDGKPPSASVALEARGLTLVRGRRVVLRDVHLALAPGEMVALQGANGAGKSSLLHCLATALQPTAGCVLWFGESPAKSPIARRKIGFLGHDSGAYPALTAWENLHFAGRMYGVDNAAQRADRLLEAVGLTLHQHQPARCLSRGMRQRLAIARAVIHDPPILLLDEPFTCLDALSRNWLGEFLRGLRGHGCAILVASHEVDRSLFDRVVVLQGGRLSALECDPAEPFKQRPSYVWRP